MSIGAWITCQGLNKVNAYLTGKINFMFAPEVYIARRKQLKKKIGKGTILLLGNEESSINFKDNWYPFRQDSTFLYYTGIDIPGAR